MWPDTDWLSGQAAGKALWTGTRSGEDQIRGTGCCCGTRTWAADLSHRKHRPVNADTGAAQHRHAADVHVHGGGRTERTARRMDRSPLTSLSQGLSPSGTSTSQGLGRNMPTLRMCQSIQWKMSNRQTSPAAAVPDSDCPCLCPGHVAPVFASGRPPYHMEYKLGQQSNRRAQW